MKLSSAQLILASSSSYRKSMLQRLGIPFQTISPDIDETPQEGEMPAALSLRLAKRKAEAVAKTCPGAVVIGADQVATCGKDLIGKPLTHQKAVEQLRLLSGRSVAFHSALAVTDGTNTYTTDVVTETQFRQLTEAEIEHYLHYEKPYDTAGSAKAESLGISLMEHMRSDDPTAIIGLPLIELCRMLRRFGINPAVQAVHL